MLHRVNWSNSVQTAVEVVSSLLRRRDYVIWKCEFEIETRDYSIGGLWVERGPLTTSAWPFDSFITGVISPSVCDV